MHSYHIDANLKNKITALFVILIPPKIIEFLRFNGITKWIQVINISQNVNVQIIMWLKQKCSSSYKVSQKWLATL